MVWGGVSILKKNLLILIICYSVAMADSAKAKLIENIIEVLFADTKISLFVQDKAYMPTEGSKIFKNAPNCESAEVIIVKSFDSVSKKCLETAKYAIVTSYGAYKKDEDALGAIFWQKGRLNLIFREKKLEELELSLPSSYDRYIE